MKRLPILALSALAISSLAAATAFGARPFTLNDLLGVVRVGDPQVSPDGAWVAYVRTTTNLEAGKRNSDLWVMPFAGGPGKQLTRFEGSDSSPRFSPDGKKLAFVSTRSGSPQIHLIDLSGGEAEKLTDMPLGVDGGSPVVWSKDGKKLAFASDTYPDCADLACVRKRSEEKDKSPVKVHKATRLLFRHWDEWRTDVRKHVYVMDLATKEVKDLTPGDFDSPTVQYEDGGFTFSPDGSLLAFVSNREGIDREAFTTNMDVFLVPVSGGTPENVTKGNTGADIAPQFSADGATLAVRSQRRAGFEADRWYVDLYDVKSKAKRTLFPDVDLSVSDVVFAGDGKGVYLTADRAGRGDLFRAELSGGAPQEVLKGGSIGSLRATATGVVFSKATLLSPPELFVLEGVKERALTNENASWKAEVDMGSRESLSAKGALGADIQYWLVKPPAFDAAKKYPVVFLIHGGPQGAWEDGWSARWNPALWAAQGWIVVAPNPRGSTGFGQKFVDEISQDWGGKVMTDLDGVFDAVVKLPYVDPKRQGVAGASYGGYAVNWLVGTRVDRFKAAVTHDGVFNLESMHNVTEELWFPDWEAGGAPWTPKAKEYYAKWSPHQHAHKVKTPTLIITNELDYRVPVDQGIQMFTILRRNGVPAEMLVFPDEGHWVLKPLNSKRWHEEVFSWLKRWL